MNKILFFLALFLCFVVFSMQKLTAQVSKDKISAVVWKTADGVSIPVPPKDHPRLFINPDEAAQLKNRLNNPVLETLVSNIRADALKSVQTKIEWDAINFVIHKDASLVRSASVGILIPL